MGLIQDGPTWFVHLALLLVEGMGVGFGTVIAKIGLVGIDPIVFAFYRDALAFPILGVWSYCTERATLKRRDVPRLILAGFFLFVSNICYTIGVKISNAVTGAAWQAAAPVFTAAIAITIRWERATSMKLAGIGLAFAGAAFIVMFHQDLAGSGFLGNMLFLLNVNGYSCYCLATRPLLRDYPPLMITALSFVVVAILLLFSAIIAHAVPGIHDASTMSSPWDMDGNAMIALAYFVVVYSVLLYSVITWANQFVPGSTVMAYAVAQPVAAALLEFVLIRAGYNRAHPPAPGDSPVLQEPGLNALGVIGVAAGLWLIVRGDITAAEEAEVQAPLLSPSCAPPRQSTVEAVDVHHQAPSKQV